MNFTFHQLRVFVYICDYQSITKASEALFMTQPAVSIQLKKFQDQFDIPLTEVIGRQLYVTKFGEEVLEVARRILAEADNLSNTVNRFKGLMTGKIKIAVVSTGKYVMPYFLNSFVKKYPQVEMKMDVTNKLQVVDALVKNETDFALVSVLPDKVALESITLMKNHLFLMGSKEEAQRLNKKKLQPADLSKIPLIFRENGSATRASMDQYMHQHRIPVKRTLQLVSNEAVKQAVNAGLGFSIMPLIGLRHELLHEEMVMIPTKDLPIITTWRVVYNKGKRLTPAAEAFLSYLQASREELIEKHFSWTGQFIED